MCRPREGLLSQSRRVSESPTNLISMIDTRRHTTTLHRRVQLRRLLSGHLTAHFSSCKSAPGETLQGGSPLEAQRHVTLFPGLSA